MIVNHAALLTAVHAQPAVVVTVTVVPGPPARRSTDSAARSRTHRHGGAAACVTVNVWPAIVSVPVRSAPVFAAIVKSTDPLPVPLAPDVIVNHAALLTAVHAQPAVVVTVTVVPGPPAAPIDWLVGAIVYAQAGGAAACVTVNVWPAIVSVPVRSAPVFAAT